MERYRTAFPSLLPVAGPLGAKIVPCATQNAHADIVTAVEWRTSTKHGEKKYQLVSWSKDQHLKFWKIDQPIFVRAPPKPLCSHRSLSYVRNAHQLVHPVPICGRRVICRGLQDCLSGRGPSEGDLFTMPGTPVNSLGVPSPRGHRSSPRDEQRVGLTQEFALMRQNPIRGITIKTVCVRALCVCAYVRACV